MGTAGLRVGFGAMTGDYRYNGAMKNREVVDIFNKVAVADHLQVQLLEIMVIMQQTAMVPVLLPVLATEVTEDLVHRVMVK